MVRKGRVGSNPTPRALLDFGVFRLVGRFAGVRARKLGFVRPSATILLYERNRACS